MLPLLGGPPRRGGNHLLAARRSRAGAFHPVAFKRCGEAAPIPSSVMIFSRGQKSEDVLSLDFGSRDRTVTRPLQDTRIHHHEVTIGSLFS